MHRGFNVQIVALKEDENYQNFHRIGKNLFDSKSKQVRPILNKFIQNDKALDGTSIQNAWFPLVEADIFLSHSHKSLDLALVLAGWFYEKFGLTTFIDSCIWGHADELIRELDLAHCKTGPSLFSYELRNHSTAHVHMMLATALNMMIDKTESLFFLNNPNSIKSYGKIDKTESPWIYAEVAATHFLRDRLPDRLQLLLEETSNFSGDDNISKSLKIAHTVDLSNLNKLYFEDLEEWRKNLRKGIHPLDVLYRLHTPVIKKTA